MSTFRAIRIDKADKGVTAAFVDFDEAELMDGDVDVAITHTTVNYKDGLNVTGKAPIARRFPMIPGIDFAGIVERSTAPAFKPGDSVLLTGYGVGEGHLGGFAQKARVKSDWLVPLPQGLSPVEAMAIGTAGFTAMLSVLALERFGMNPDMGPVVVTGAAGGVKLRVFPAFQTPFAWLLILIKSRPVHLGRLITVWFFAYLREYSVSRASVTWQKGGS